MREFQQKRRIKRRIYSTPVIIILIFVIDGTWKVYQKDRESKANLARAQNELTSLNTRDATLTSDIARLKTNQGVEDEIRSKYEVSKPGEQVLVIVDKDSSTTSTSTGNVIEQWWSKFLSLFKRN
jgi:cell division protein FtsB